MGNINYGSKSCLNPKAIVKDGEIPLCQFCGIDIATSVVFVDTFETCAFHHCDRNDCSSKTEASLENWKQHRDANALLKGKATFCVQRSSGEIDSGWQFYPDMKDHYNNCDLNSTGHIKCLHVNKNVVKTCDLSSLLFANQPIQH